MFPHEEHRQKSQIPIRRDNSSRQLEHMCVVTLRIPFLKDSYFHWLDQVNYTILCFATLILYNAIEKHFT